MYKYKVTYFDATILDTDKNPGEKIRVQLEDQLEQHANDGWDFVGQYDFSYTVGATGCFGKATGKAIEGGLDRKIQQLVFRKEV